VLATSHWDGYTVFSVISGVLLILMSFTPGMKPGSRVLGVVGGIALATYGIWVANQTTGTYYFSVYIFIVPVIALISFVKTLGSPKTPARSTPTRNRSATGPVSSGAPRSTALQTGPVTSNLSAQTTASSNPGFVSSPPPLPSEANGKGSSRHTALASSAAPSRTQPLPGEKIVIVLNDLGQE